MNKRKKELGNAIVELVERTGGPVTLARIEREVPGFAAENAPRHWSWVTEDGHVIWDGMTERGCEALRRVVKERRVAIQCCPRPVYAFEGLYPLDPAWVPIVLVPASMANMDTPGPLIRGSQRVLDAMLARAATEGVGGFRVIGPPA